METVEGRLVERTIDLAPSDVVLTRGLFDEELVLRRTARERARVADQGSVSGDDGLMATHGFLVQIRDAEIPVHARHAPDPHGFQADSSRSVRHSRSLTCRQCRHKQGILTQ